MIFLVSDQTFPLKNENRIIRTTFNDPLIFLVIGITLAQCLRQKPFHFKEFHSNWQTEKEFIFSTINPIVSPHSVIPPSRSPFLKGEVNFDYLPRSGGIRKTKKRGGSMRGWRGGVTLFLFNFFKVYHFYI